MSLTESGKSERRASRSRHSRIHAKRFIDVAIRWLNRQAMDRIVGVETEYGCLMSSEELRCNSEVWPAKVKNYLFNKARAGTIDLHYRDYEEPPGNGGFLLNGGRLYLDMGHIEYASPECLHLRDVVAYDIAGDQLLPRALQDLGGAEHVSFIKNNIDHP